MFIIWVVTCTYMPETQYLLQQRTCSCMAFCGPGHFYAVYVCDSVPTAGMAHAISLNYPSLVWGFRVERMPCCEPPLGVNCNKLSVISAITQSNRSSDSCSTRQGLLFDSHNNNCDTLITNTHVRQQSMDIFNDINEICKR